jgi:hypothetical protein
VIERQLILLYGILQEKLCQLVVKRIGLETFLDKLSEVSRHEMYSRAAKHPQLKLRQSSELILDHEFCRLFKALEGKKTEFIFFNFNQT